MDLNGIFFMEEDFLEETITEADILTQEDEKEEVFTIMLVKSVVEPTTLLWTTIIDWILNIDNNLLLTSKVKEIKVKEISSHKHCLLPVQRLNQNKCPENYNPEFHAPQTLPPWWTTSVTQPTTSIPPGSAPDSATTSAPVSATASAPGSAPSFLSSSNLPSSSTEPAPAPIHITAPAPVQPPPLTISLPSSYSFSSIHGVQSC
ncbi:hypothetical protein U1Q18_043916 [Sarracenia purpurea var. burkii]